MRDRNAGRVRYLPGYQPAANEPEIEVELRFANQWADEESGLHYNLNRHYAPEVVQYASQDPLGPAGGLRTHRYVNNPLTWADPLELADRAGVLGQNIRRANKLLSQNVGYMNWFRLARRFERYSRLPVRRAACRLSGLEWQLC